MIPLLSTDLARDQRPGDLERVRRNHHDAIAELQKLPLAGARILRDIVMVDGAVTPIAHGLGRPAFVLASPPRGGVTAGRIEEIRDGSHDRNRYAVLKASGWGASITVDVLVL
jgi:hypothetical protein